MSSREDEYIITIHVGAGQVLVMCKGISVGMRMYNGAIMFQTVTMGHS